MNNNERRNTQGERQRRQMENRASNRYEESGEVRSAQLKDSRNRNGKNKKKALSANAKWGIALLVEVVVMIILVACFAVWYVNDKLGKVQRVELNDDVIEANEGANEMMKGYKTIALFGIDSRSKDDMGEGNRTDCIIIMSINNDTKEVKMVSIYRDTLLLMDDGSNLTTKVNAAYSYGGPELAIKTLNKNLDLEITDFVTVNFLALTKAIDDLGGLDIEVKSGELEMMNAAIAEQMSITGIYSDGVFETGLVHLNGTQATAWSRVRSTDQGDITRTERQRTVISKMISKAKKSGLSAIDEVLDDVCPNIYTSLEKDEMKDMIKEMFDYELVDSVGFPMAYTPVDHESKGSILVPANLNANVSALHKYLFNTDNYEPTQTVQNISNQIENETGVREQQIDINVLPPAE